MPLKNRRNQTSLAHTRSKSESRAINICLATNGGCPFSPLGVNVETVRTIFTIVPPAAPTSSTCFLTHNVISPVYARLRGVVGQVLPRNVGGTTWRTDPWTRIYAHCSVTRHFSASSTRIVTRFSYSPLKLYTAGIVLEHRVTSIHDDFVNHVRGSDFPSTSRLFHLIRSSSLKWYFACRTMHIK